MLPIVLHLHSGFRWLLVLLAVIALVRCLFGWILRKEYTRLDSVLMLSFRILIDVQILLGIVMIVGMGVSFGFPAYHFFHATAMVVALILVHSTAHRWDEFPAAAQFRNSFIMILAVSVIIAVGVLFLPQGWSFSPGILPK
jgi:hypothetical protein